MKHSHSSTDRRLLIVLADLQEAKALIQEIPFQKCSSHTYRYEDARTRWDLMILQRWGKEGVLASLSPSMLSHYHGCVNLGFAGACSLRFPRQACYTISEVSLPDTPYHPLTTVPSLPTARLVSFHEPYRQGLHDTFELVDMEGYTLATICQEAHRTCWMIKVVSDYTTPNGGEYLHRHKSRLARRLSQTFISCMPAISHHVENGISSF